MNFTIEQINQAHSKVKSGADFPAYIQDLIQIGISKYDSFVSDGHVDYFGSRGHKTSSPPKYDTLDIANELNSSQFKSDLKAHQAGKTDYPGFCRDSARSGIEKWSVNMHEMTCTYFDKKGKMILIEQIPAS